MPRTGRCWPTRPTTARNTKRICWPWGAEEFLLRKAPRGQALSAAEQKSNHTISRIRVRVEHIFARMAQMGADFCRSIGLARATAHNHLCNLVYNMDRYACLRK